MTEVGLGVPYSALWSALLNAELRRGAHVIRLADTTETASVVRLLVQKGCASPPLPSGIAPPTALTKRKRDAEPKLVFMRQLMCIPTVEGGIVRSFQIRVSRGEFKNRPPEVSENVARKLHEKFGTMTALQDALRQKKFPKIELDGRSSIGKARREKLATYLL